MTVLDISLLAVLETRIAKKKSEKSLFEFDFDLPTNIRGKLIRFASNINQRQGKCFSFFF